MKHIAGLKNTIKNLAGEEVRNSDGSSISVGSVISNLIATGQSKEPVRMITLATKIYSGGDEIDVDDQDFDMVNTQIHDNKVWTDMVKAACLTVWVDKQKVS